MAKRNKTKFAAKSRKSALRVEALEQRQLLSTVTGGGTEVGSNIHHQNGNVYDQVLMTGSSVTVTADSGQITRVSYLDMNGDIVQAEFSGRGTLTVSLDQVTTTADGSIAHLQPSDMGTYNQTVEGTAADGTHFSGYVQGNASFIIQGEDASTNFLVTSVGANNAVNSALFDATHTGGDHFADIASIKIVADPTNPGNFSTFGAIYAGDAHFSANSGIVGISAGNVNVQGPVVIGNIDAHDAGVPTLNFGGNSQFGTLVVAGGDLSQTNGASFAGNINGFTNINSTNGTDSSGAAIASHTLVAAGLPTVVTLDTTKSFDITGWTQAQLDTAFNGRTFTEAVTITGDLGSTKTLSATEFRHGVTFSGEVDGTVKVSGGIDSLATGKLTGQVYADWVGNVSVTGDDSGVIAAHSVGNVSVDGDYSGFVTTDVVTVGGFVNSAGDNVWTIGSGEKGIGNVSITGSITDHGGFEGILGIGNITVGGDITSDGLNALLGATKGVFVTSSGNDGDAYLGSIGTLTVAGDVDQGLATNNLIDIGVNGNFGAITIGGAGSLGKTDNTDFVTVGNIVVGGSLGLSDSVTGAINITETTSDLQFAGLSVKGGVGSVGAVTITGPGAVKTDLALGTISSSVALGTVTVSDFNDITVAGINGKSTDVISIKTIAADKNNASTITLNGDIGSATTALGNVILDAGTADNNKIDFNADITGKTVGDVWVSAKTINLGATAGMGIKAADAAGTLTFTGTTNVKNAGDINLAKTADGIAFVGKTNVTGVGAINVGGALGSFMTSDTITLAAGATITTKSITGELQLTNATFGAGSQVQVAGSVGSLDLGKADFSANTQTSIRLNDGTSALDTLGNVTATSIKGATGINDITASSIGDITIKGALTQDQALVTDFNVLAAPNNKQIDGTPAVASNVELVAKDGSNLASFGIGNISVSSQLDLAYTGTSLFSGYNSFAGLKIGDISLMGAVSGAQQSALFGTTSDSAYFASGDVDGLDNQLATLPSLTIQHTDGTDAVTSTILTGGTFSIGNITVNARQSDVSSPQVSGVDNINGSAGSGFEGLGILAGVRASNAAGAAGDIITLHNAAAPDVNVTAIDADVKGTIGTVLISSNNAVGYYDAAATASLRGTVDGQLTAGIVAATSAGKIQNVAAIASDAAMKTAIIGDSNSTADDTVGDLAGAGANEIVVVVL